ncbi:hypothetical protein DFH07DRAFT_778164 [Mycena maculata]|uniref:Uncharacterized protein n=1 Tax=Mycena maculata TaxID=230809 RepID=A0AAD7IGD1_9AGAR|nr:hypothetical protein DFH07DRAFT_778164 [Mycena maculata]
MWSGFSQDFSGQGPTRYNSIAPRSCVHRDRESRQPPSRTRGTSPVTPPELSLSDLLRPNVTSVDPRRVQTSESLIRIDTHSLSSPPLLRTKTSGRGRNDSEQSPDLLYVGRVIQIFPPTQNFRFLAAPTASGSLSRTPKSGAPVVALLLNNWPMFANTTIKAEIGLTSAPAGPLLKKISSSSARSTLWRREMRALDLDLLYIQSGKIQISASDLLYPGGSYGAGGSRKQGLGEYQQGAGTNMGSHSTFPTGSAIM